MFHPEGPTFFELARQALSSTERGYDLLAPKFDYTPFRTPDWVVQVVADYLAGTAPLRSGLDICCGTGVGMRMLRSVCKERVVGLDVSQGMLEVCRQKQADAPGGARLEYVRANALAMPFAAVFDVAVCFGAFGHIRRQDERSFVGQVAGVLKPGGRFLFVTTSIPPWWSASYWLARLFNGAMHVRNLLVAPPFIMYYLTFLLPEAKGLLEQNGLKVEVQDMHSAGLPVPIHLVIATRPLA